MNQNEYNRQQDTETPGGPRVLSDTERRDFDGITIEEEGNDVREDTMPYERDRNESEYGTFSSYSDGTRVKVIRLGGSGWLSRIILMIILAVALAAIVFFGGIILSVVGIIVVVGAIISFIFGLF